MTRRTDIDPAKLRALEQCVQPICRAVDYVTPDRTGFAVLLFDFDGPEITYGANAERADMIRALRECADTLEQQQDTLPGTDGRARGRG